MPGRCGDLDVKDCHNALTTVLEAMPTIDAERVFVFGGSHGGFLAAHLIGQYPQMFKGAAMRNPVIDLNGWFLLLSVLHATQ